MFRSFAIIPAAGTSARMGAPKLLLPWRGRPLIAHALGAWRASRVTRAVVVVRGYDRRLVDCCQDFDVDILVLLDPPADMKESVQAGLRHIRENYAPAPQDVWLLAPADLPQLSSRVIDAVLKAFDAADPTAVVPSANGRRGHPVLLPWSMANEVEGLAAGEGVNTLLDRGAGGRVSEISCDEPLLAGDIDTPADYARLAEIPVP